MEGAYDQEQAGALGQALGSPGKGTPVASLALHEHAGDPLESAGSLPSMMIWGYEFSSWPNIQVRNMNLKKAT